MGFALASVTIAAGRTRVLCSVCWEDEVPRWRRGSGQGWLSAEYRLLPASTPERQPRELLRAASGLTTGVFAGIVTITYVHSGLDVARTLSSRLSTSLTILVLALVAPG